MAETGHDEHLAALADELIARGVRFLREVTAANELKELREAAARIAEAEQVRDDALRRLANAEDHVRTLEAAVQERDALLAGLSGGEASKKLREVEVKVVEFEAELLTLRSEHQFVIGAFQGQFAEAEQARSDALRRAEKAEDKVRALETAAREHAVLDAADQQVSEREALL
jgi:hypothetical protein